VAECQEDVGSLDQVLTQARQFDARHHSCMFPGSLRLVVPGMVLDNATT